MAFLTQNVLQRPLFPGSTTPNTSGLTSITGAESGVDPTKPPPDMINNPTLPTEPPAFTVQPIVPVPPVDPNAGNIWGPGGAPAPYSATKPATAGGFAPAFDPNNLDPWINYYYRQGHGTDAPPDQLAYWRGKVTSTEPTGQWDPSTGTWVPASPDYWAMRLSGGGAGGSGGSLGSFDAGSLANLFSDPAASSLVNFIMSAVGQLSSRPSVDPTLQSYINSAQAFAAQMAQPWVNPEAASTTATLHSILDQLLGPVYTDQQNAAILAQGTDQIEEDRQNAIHNTVARMSALGHGKDSGTVAQAVADVNKAYDQQRAAAVRGITVQGTQQAAQNKAQAAQISAQLDSIAQANESFSTSRQQAGVSALGQASQGSVAQQQLNDARLSQILSLLEVPVSVSDQRLARAIQILGLNSGDPTAILNSLNAFATSTNQQNALNNAQNAGFWNALGQWVPSLVGGLTGG